MLKVGDYVEIISSDDNELEQWLEEQENKGVNIHKVIEIDLENALFWIENCTYAIWFSDNYIRR